MTATHFSGIFRRPDSLLNIIRGTFSCNILSEMDAEEAACYKLYRCRNLLACDSGGTVYDRSQRFDHSEGEAHYKIADESQSESGQSENIIYIIDQDNKVANSSPPSQQAVSCTNSYLDDDKFNDCESFSSINHQAKYHTIQHVNEESNRQDDNCKYYIVQCDNLDSRENSANNTPDSDSFDGENFEYYCDTINLSSSAEDISINSSTTDALSGSIFICDQEEAHFHHLSNFSQDTDKSLACQYFEQNYSPLKSTMVPTSKHTRKRKQSYKIKCNSFTELLDGDDSSDESLVSEVSKKKKTDYTKNNQRNKLLSYRYNPFENLRMSSILKKEHYAENHIQSRDCTRESLANDGISNLSNTSSNDEVFNFTYFPSNDHFFKIIDLTNADYLEYVQPREKIVESDMDKLLSPTIEVEISTIMKHCQRNQHHAQLTPEQLDYNGNDVSPKENINYRPKTSISASESVEKQLVSKAYYAIKLGFQNMFNTSNDCLIDEILFDHSSNYKDIKLEIDLVNIRKNPLPKVPLVLLENIDEYLTHHHHHHHHHQSNDSFKSVSCSLKDTLNEFDKCAEENGNEDNRAIKKEVDQVLSYNYESDRKERESIQSSPYSSFNIKTEVNSAGSDINANYDFTKLVSNSSMNEKPSIPPLKMRIKRVSDDNQYVVDDSSIKTSKFHKNPDSKYECSSCSEKFRTKRLLKSHFSENHKGPYDMECDICHMKSKKSSAYKRHKIWCQKSTALKCEICQKVYCYKAVLKRHLNTHKDGLQKEDVPHNNQA